MSSTTQGREREEWECLRRVEGEWEQANRHKCAGDGGRRHASDSRARCRATPHSPIFRLLGPHSCRPISFSLVSPFHSPAVPSHNSGVVSTRGRASLEQASLASLAMKDLSVFSPYLVSPPE